MFEALRHLREAVSADYSEIRRLRDKYGGEPIPDRLPLDLVRKIGLQMIAAVRVMQALEEAKIPVLPQVASRVIRHLYGAEIHWRTKIAPGVAIVHGCGLILSHAAEVGPGCILFQNVTLGENIDPHTREVGSPKLGRDVHVGPGATLLGPITVGDRTKIMAGALLTQSVPADSLVRPADITVVRRRAAGQTQEERAGAGAGEGLPT